jgi:hypothetical protein
VEWQIQLADDGRYLRVTTGGLFSLADQQRMFDDLRALPAAEARLRILFDNRRLDLTGSNVDVIGNSVQIVQAYIAEKSIERLAGLVDAGANFGIGRQFETLTDLAGGHGFRLFKDEALSIAWLRGEID